MHQLQGTCNITSEKHFQTYMKWIATAAGIFTVARKVAKAMKEVLKCSGLNLLQNNGSCRTNSFSFSFAPYTKI